ERTPPDRGRRCTPRYLVPPLRRMPRCGRAARLDLVVLRILPIAWAGAGEAGVARSGGFGFCGCARGLDPCHAPRCDDAHRLPAAVQSPDDGPSHRARAIPPKCCPLRIAQSRSAGARGGDAAGLETDRRAHLYRLPAASSRDGLQFRLHFDRWPEGDLSRVPKKEAEEMSIFLTDAQIDDVRREIIVLREMGDHGRADYWEARLEEEIERREPYVPPEPKSRHPSAARAFDAARLLCSVADCDAPHLPGTRWCEAHRPRFGEAA